MRQQLGSHLSPDVTAGDIHRKCAQREIGRGLISALVVSRPTKRAMDTATTAKVGPRAFAPTQQAAINFLTINIVELATKVSDYSAFAKMERGGWSDAARASGYVELFASASGQAISSLLNGAGAKPNCKALDLCCGQGNASQALLSRGCEVIGIDFSPAMLAFARQRALKAAFIEGDAQNLPFDDAEFDIAVSNLGVCHIPDQPRALAEARRVLRPGGKFAMTVWCGPDASPCFAAVYGAIKTYGHPEVSAPLGPDFAAMRVLGRRVTPLGDTRRVV
jgi:SAM-dependent methyltransferase